MPANPEKGKTIVFASLFEKKEAVEKLIEESEPTLEYYFLLLASTLIATLGLLLNSPTVVIGGMLLAPLFSPILSIGLGTVISRLDLIKRGGLVILKSMAIAVLAALILAFLFNFQEANLEILTKSVFNFEYFLVSLIAGLAGTYLWVKPQLINAIAGIVIAVALIPPLGALGIGIQLLSREIITGSLSAFIGNLIGIILGSILMFTLFGFGKQAKSVEAKVEATLKEVNENKQK